MESESVAYSQWSDDCDDSRCILDAAKKQSRHVVLCKLYLLSKQMQKLEHFVFF